MKFGVRCILKKENKKIFNSKGNTFIEFLLGVIVLIVILYTFFQVYFLTYAYILMLNTAKVTVRNIEVFGGVVNPVPIRVGVYGEDEHGNFVNGGTLAKSANLDRSSIKLTVNGDEFRTISAKTWYPLRGDIEVILEGDYIFSSGIKLGPNFKIPLRVKYVGSSQRMRKDGTPDFVPITE